MEKKHPIHPGWLVAFACALTNATVFVSHASLPGLFTVPVSEALGFQRAVFATHITLGNLASMVSSLFASRLFLRYPPRALMVTGTLAASLCYIGKAFSAEIWQFYLTSVLASLFSGLTGIIAVSLLLNNWFGPKLRGKVMGIVQSGSSLGIAILSPIISSVIQSKGWESGYLLMGILLLAIAPILLVCVKDSPQRLGLERLGEAEPAAPSASGSSAPGGAPWKSAPFLLMTAGFFFAACAAVFFNSNIQGHLINIGLSMTAAGAWVSIGSLATTAGKIALGAAADKWGIRRSMTVNLVSLFLGAVLLSLSGHFAGLMAPGIILFCLGNCTCTLSLPLVIADRFGSSGYSTLVSIANLVASAGAAAAPVLGGLVYDLTGSYILGWICISLLVAAAIAVLNLGYAIRPREKSL